MNEAKKIGNPDSLRQLVQAEFNKNKRSSFKYGYIGSAPFVSGNGTPKGVIPDALNEVARDLNLQSEAVHLSCHEFRNSLERSEIDMIADPILPIIGRPFNIVPYTSVVSCVAAYEVGLKDKGIIDETLSLLGKSWYIHFNAKNFSELKNSQEAMQIALTRLDSATNGLAVTEGLFEEAMLNLFGVPLFERMNQTDVSTNVQNGLRNGKFVIADMSSIQTALSRLPEDRRHAIHVCNLFGTQLRVPAGFAFHPKSKHLCEYFIYQCQSQDGLLRGLVDEQLNGQLKSSGDEHNERATPWSEVVLISPSYASPRMFIYNLTENETSPMHSLSVSISTDVKDLYPRLVDDPDYENKSRLYNRFVSGGYSLGLTMLLVGILLWGDSLVFTMTPADVSTYGGVLIGLGIEILIAAIAIQLGIGRRFRK